MGELVILCSFAVCGRISDSKLYLQFVVVLLHILTYSVCCILCVCFVAVSDIATIDILERAQKADPEGHRTIGVLTKPDLIGNTSACTCSITLYYIIIIIDIVVIVVIVVDDTSCTIN